MAYNDPQQVAIQQQQQEQMLQQQYQDDGSYGYNYPGDMWAGRQSNDQAAQVRQALFHSKFSEMSEDQQKEWFMWMQSMIERVAKIPGIDAYDVDRIYRKFKFLVNRANSQRCASVMETRAQELTMLIELHFAKADVPLAGLSAVGAMITTNNNQKQEIRYPVQQQATPGIMDVVRNWRGR